MNTTPPPPRLVPDRPSDAAIAQAFWELATNDDLVAKYNGALLAWVHTRANEIDAAAPPAEAVIVAVAPAARFPDDGNGDDDAYNKGWNDCRAFAIASKYAAPAGEEVPTQCDAIVEDAGYPTNPHACSRKAVPGSKYCTQHSRMYDAAPAAPAPDTAGDDKPVAWLLRDRKTKVVWMDENSHFDNEEEASLCAMDMNDEIDDADFEPFPVYTRAPRVTGGREAEFVVELLIEAGHVPRGRVSQARAIAKNAAIQAATGGADHG